MPFCMKDWPVKSHRFLVGLRRVSWVQNFSLSWVLVCFGFPRKQDSCFAREEAKHWGKYKSPSRTNKVLPRLRRWRFCCLASMTGATGTMFFSRRGDRFGLGHGFRFRFRFRLGFSLLGASHQLALNEAQFFGYGDGVGLRHRDSLGGTPVEAVMGVTILAGDRCGEDGSRQDSGEQAEGQNELHLGRQRESSGDLSNLS